MATDADDLIGRNKISIELLLIYIIAGRSDEMQVFMEELMHVSERTHKDFGVLIITGTGGIGKTKLLRAMKAKAAMMNFRCWNKSVAD